MDLFYRKYGEGKPIIILHGLYGMSDNWMTIGKHLAEHNFAVYIPDQRNHGDSPHSDDFNYEVLGNDLNDFIGQHSLADPIIIGHSMGGKVAMNFALKHRDIIQKLIVVDIGIKQYPAHDDEIVDALLSAEIETASSRNEIEDRLAKKIKNSRVRQLMMKNVRRVAEGDFDWKLNLRGIKNNFLSMFEGVASDYPYPGRVLFIRGGLSLYIQDEDLPGIKKLFLNAEFATIAGASHWTHADKPEEFLEIVTSYLS